MERELFEMAFELEDIEECYETGYKNTYDITVSGDHTFLLGNGTVSHNSAVGGIMPVLGRKEVGFYELKGKPLNAYSSTQAKFTQNKELSELYQVIQNEGYQYIITATDADLDGTHIVGLLLGFFQKYMPELKGKVGSFTTPVIAVKKGQSIQRWYYSLNEKILIKPGETSKYYKGLGSHSEKDLKHILQKDGLQNMIKIYDWDEDAITLIDDWLGEKNSDKRKEYIQANDFNIASA